MKKLFYNGKLRSMDANDSTFEAMITEDGKITATGTNKK